jgi:C-terminal processing protease CtpA/Prc
MPDFRISSLQIKTGDRLVSVDLFAVDPLNHHQIVRMVRGTAGTRVKLGLRRPSNADAVPGSDLYYVTLERAPPPPPNLSSSSSPSRGAPPEIGSIVLVL